MSGGAAKGVLSVTQFECGDAYSMIAQRARKGGTARAMKRETLSFIEVGAKRERSIPNICP